MLQSQTRTEAQARISEALGCLRQDPQHGIVYENYASFSLAASALFKLLKLPGDLIAKEQAWLVSNSLIQLFKNSKTKLEDFEKILAECLKAKLRQPKTRYHVLAVAHATLTKIKNSGTVLSAKLPHCTVRLGYEFPRAADTSPWKLSGYGEVKLVPQKPHVPIWATVAARTEAEALERGVGAIKSVLGTVNFVLNFQKQRFNSGRDLPKNRIRLIQEHVVYRADWSRYEDLISYDPPEEEERWLVDLTEDLPRVQVFLKKALSRLNDQTFGKLLSAAMNDYYEALSHVDPALVHTRLWSLLERLTSTPSDKGPATIRRASFLSNQTELRRRRLNQAAEARHAIVHRSERTPFLTDISDDLKNWTDQILLYLFRTKVRFEDLDMFFEMLDAPQTEAQIQRKMKVLRIALADRRAHKKNGK